jgi:hypothetical protein
VIKLDPVLESEVSASAEKYFWQARLHSGHRIPTRRLMSLALQAIQDFREAGGNLPTTDMSRFVDAAEAWLDRQRGRIWKLAAAEEAEER